MNVYQQPYYILCDSCERNGPIRDDPLMASRAAVSMGWLVEPESYLCPDCQREATENVRADDGKE